MSIATQDPQVVTEFLFIYTVYIYSFLIIKTLKNFKMFNLISSSSRHAPILAQKPHQDCTKKHRRATAYLTDQVSNSIKYLAQPIKAKRNPYP